MRILVTGGAGYIGTGLIPKLLALPNAREIVIYDNLSRSNHNLFLGNKYLSAEKLRFVRGELLDSRKLKDVLKDVDVVYHLAAKVRTPLSDQSSHEFEQVNHWGTAELVYAIEESPVRRFIFTSSVAVYGASDDEDDITTVPSPRSFYGMSKLRAEEHVRRLAGKLPTYIIRCGNVYGYNKSMRFDALINKFALQAHFGQRLNVQGSGEQRRAFVHIDQVASCLARLADSEVTPETYNLVTRNMSVLEVVESLKELYPGLEMIFVNQHIKMRQLIVKPDNRLSGQLPETERSFLDELKEFREQFAF